MGLVVAIDSEAASKVPALVNRDDRDHIGLVVRQHGEALGEKRDGLAHTYHKLCPDRVEHECGGLGLPTAWRPRWCTSWFRSGTKVATRSDGVVIRFEARACRGKGRTGSGSMRPAMCGWGEAQRRRLSAPDRGRQRAG